MSEEEIKKQKDLLELKKLTSLNFVGGCSSNLWLNHLLNKYPWEYLMFTQYNTFKTGRRKLIEEKIKEKWIFRLLEIQKLNLEERDVDFLNGVLDYLDYFIKEKKTEKNN
jgi:hypothetical protein